jgi:CRISPR-associated protein Csh2
MSNQSTLPVAKSEILFLYESTFSVPNGDPFTGEQRYDEETKKILVSDVRIKRFIRDYFVQINDLLPEEKKYSIYVLNDRTSVTEGTKETGSSARMKSLKKLYAGEKSAIKIMQKCIDVRLFGGISTEEKDAVNLTGPIQFSLLNASLNSVDLRMHQNTSVFASSTEKSRGAIGTTTVVPYSLNQIHGWVNPFSAVHTSLSNIDIQEMLRALWYSINNANTRTKSNQNSLLLLNIVYNEPMQKLYGIDRFIKIVSEKRDEQLRERKDYSLDFSALKEAASSEKVKEIQFYTEVQQWSEELAATNKFKSMGSL